MNNYKEAAGFQFLLFFCIKKPIVCPNHCWFERV